MFGLHRNTQFSTVTANNTKKYKVVRRKTFDPLRRVFLFVLDIYGNFRYNRIRNKFITDRMELLNNQEWMHQKFVTEGLQLKQIAELLGTTTYFVKTALIKFGLFVKAYEKPSEAARACLSDRAWLHDRRIVQGLSLASIATQIGVDKGAVKRACTKLGVDDVNYLCVSQDALKYLSDYDWMYKKRVEERCSYTSIAKLIGVSKTPVIEWCEQHNFPKISYNKIPEHISDVLCDREWLVQKYKDERLSCAKIANLAGVCANTAWQFLKMHDIEINKSEDYGFAISSAEGEIVEFIKGFYNGEIITSDRSILGDGREIDIYIPALKFAIEYNGVYFHTFRPECEGYSGRKDSSYHLSKTTICASKDIELIHIWSIDWNTNKEIWKSRIKAKFGAIDKKIFARSCEVRMVDVSEKNTFLDQNHLQGRDRSNIKLGLYKGDELLSVMTFIESRYNKQVEWELSRFATKINCLVVGGFSKLLKYFRSQFAGSIVSYADRTHSVGNVYSKNGFRLTRTNPAGYGYVKNGTEVILNRQNFMKAKIAEPGDIRTEFEIMTDLGYRKIFDCGTLTYVLE